MNYSPEAITYSCEITTTPVTVEDYKPTATLVLDSVKFKKTGLFNVLKSIEDILYGTDKTDPKFPTISEIMETYLLAMYLRDSNNDTLLDSSGNRIQSSVFD